MVMDTFQEAFRRVIEKLGEHVWNNMHSGPQAELLYQEMRALDAECIAAANPAPVSDVRKPGDR
jgi:hypothetical protein